LLLKCHGLLEDHQVFGIIFLWRTIFRTLKTLTIIAHKTAILRGILRSICEAEWSRKILLPASNRDANQQQDVSTRRCALLNMTDRKGAQQAPLFNKASFS
jgi:hypothetical protein